MSAHFCIGAFSQLFYCNRFLGKRVIGLHHQAELQDSSESEAGNVSVELRHLLDAKQEPFVLHEAIQEKKRPVRRKSSRVIVNEENSTATMAASDSFNNIRELLLQSADNDDTIDTTSLSDDGIPACHRQRGPPERMLVIPPENFGHSRNSPSKTKAGKNHQNFNRKKALLVDAAIKILEGNNTPSRKLSSASVLLQLADVNGGRKDRRQSVKRGLSSTSGMAKAAEGDRSDRSAAAAKRAMSQLRILQRKQKSGAQRLNSNNRADRLMNQGMVSASLPPETKFAGFEICGHEKDSQRPNVVSLASVDRREGSSEHRHIQRIHAASVDSEDRQGDSPEYGHSQADHFCCGPGEEIHQSTEIQGYGFAEENGSSRVQRNPSLSLKICEDENLSSDGRDVDGEAAGEFQQSSPVSVLDTVFEEEDSSMASDVVDHFEETRQQLLHSVRRFEMLAQMDIEMLMKLAEEEDEVEGSVHGAVDLGDAEERVVGSYCRDDNSDDDSDAWGSPQGRRCRSQFRVSEQRQKMLLCSGYGSSCDAGSPGLQRKNSNVGSLEDLIIRFKQGTRSSSQSLMYCLAGSSSLSSSLSETTTVSEAPNSIMAAAEFSPWPELPQQISQLYCGHKLPAMIDGILQLEMGSSSRHWPKLVAEEGVGEVGRRLEDAVMAMLLQELVADMV